MSDAPKFYSFHAFLFPFEWKFRREDHATFEEKTDLSQLIQLMGNDGKHWKRRGSWLDVNSVVQYNETVFFYDFVRPAMYDTEKEDSLLAHYYYQLPDPEHTDYVIEIHDRKTYRLQVDDIVISFYDNGVGVLAFHLYNRRKEQSSPDDIQLINQYGRRLYPPFLGTDNDLIGTQEFFDDKDWPRALEVVKQKVLARSITLEYSGGRIAHEDFHDWAIAPTIDREPGIVKDLLSGPFLNAVTLNPVIDDRMFVICWYGHDELSAKYSKKERFRKDDWWYRYIFVDGEEKTCQNEEMVAKLVEKHTNWRWLEYGTLYGASRYSMVCLTSTMETQAYNRIICSHMQTIYYKIALLCLVQRAGVIRFSDEVTAISQLAEKDPKIAKRVSSLYRQYLRFINKIYFREVNPQEQGIELYDLLRKHMRLEEQAKELEVEVRELNQYAMILEGARRNKKLDLLTYLGAFLLGPSFIGTYLGANQQYLELGWGGIAMLCFVSAALSFTVVLTRGKLQAFFIALAVLFFLGFLFFFGSPDAREWIYSFDFFSINH